MNGVSFGGIPSYDSLHLILEPFTPAPAMPQLNLLKIPGRDGYLDLTEANGEVKYNSREFTFNFTIAPNDELTFDERVSLVSKLLNGLSCNITLDRDPGYYWKGRCIVDKHEQDKNIGRIVVKATVEPYKLKNGFSRAAFDLTSTATTYRVVNNGRKTVVPTILQVGAGTVIQIDSKTYEVSAAGKIPGIRFVSGTNLLRMSGSGQIIFEWQEGEL